MGSDGYEYESVKDRLLGRPKHPPVYYSHLGEIRFARGAAFAKAYIEEYEALGDRFGSHGGRAIAAYDNVRRRSPSGTSLPAPLP